MMTDARFGQILPILQRVPFFLNKNINFTLSDLYQKMEIIAYSSKTIPENMIHSGILTQELVAILEALKSFAC